MEAAKSWKMNEMVIPEMVVNPAYGQGVDLVYNYLNITELPKLALALHAEFEIFAKFVLGGGLASSPYE